MTPATLLTAAQNIDCERDAAEINDCAVNMLRDRGFSSRAVLQQDRIMMEDRGILGDWTAYKRASRAGLMFPLGRVDRMLVWAAIESSRKAGLYAARRRFAA